jgi:hypothetical protein
VSDVLNTVRLKPDLRFQSAALEALQTGVEDVRSDSFTLFEVHNKYCSIWFQCFRTSSAPPTTPITILCTFHRYTYSSLFNASSQSSQRHGVGAPYPRRAVLNSRLTLTVLHSTTLKPKSYTEISCKPNVQPFGNCIFLNALQ